jgi:cell division protein FtsN
VSKGPVERYRPIRHCIWRVFLSVAAAVLLAQATLAAPPQQDSARRYVVQVGAFGGPRTAAPLASELTRKGFPTLVVPGADYARVVVGPFARESEASAALSRLQQQGYRGYIRSDLPIPSDAPPARAPEPPAPAPRQSPPAPRQAPPEPAPAAAPPPQPTAQGSYVIQVGAYAGLQAAAPLTDDLLQRGFPAIVVPGDDYARVVVGPFANETEATQALSVLQQQGYQGYVRNDLPIPGSGATLAEAAPPAQEPPPVTEPPAPEPEPTAQPTEPPQVAEATPPQQLTAPAPSPELPTPTTPREVEPPPSPAVAPETTPAAPVVTAPAPEAAPEPAAPQPEVPAVPEPTAQQPTPEPSVQAPQTTEAAPAPVSEPQQQGLATLFPPTPPVQPRAGAGGLKLLIMAGEGAINNIKQRTARDPVVQVTDENDRPIAGAAITFALPDRGASGVFANGARSMTIMTDSQGTATATGLTPNAVAGDLPIKVSASYQGQTASAVITQTNAVAAGAGMSAATIGIIGAVVAGAAVGAALAFGGGDKSTSPPVDVRPSGTATIRTGGVIIGAPSQ